MRCACGLPGKCGKLLIALLSQHAFRFSALILIECAIDRLHKVAQLLQKWAVFVTWKELFDEAPTLEQVMEVVRTLNRESTLVLLCRLAIHLFLDQFRQKKNETLYLQGYLVSNFLDDAVLTRLKERMPNAELDFRRSFHSQQILTLLKLTAVHSLSNGGLEPDRDSAARFALGRCLIKTNDLLMSNQMASEIAQDRKAADKSKKFLRLQLAVGAGFEVF